MFMKFKIIAEDPHKGILKIPLTKPEIDALGDLGFMIEEHMWKNLKLNKIDKPIKSSMIKFQHLLFDVKDSGVTYSIQNNKFVKMDKPHWTIKRPNWKRQ